MLVESSSSGDAPLQYRIRRGRNEGSRVMLCIIESTLIRMTHSFL